MSTPATPTSFDPPRDRPASNCPQCGAALAADQRYCLSCGRRLTEPRVDYRGALALGGDPGGSTPGPAPHRDTRGPVLLLGGIATILLALGVGIVIGRGNGSSTSAAKPTVVTVAGGTAAPAAAAGASTATDGPATGAAGPVTDQWPASASGWTVELSSLDNSTAHATDVTAAETAATSKGAKAVGVLNGDQHSGTPTGKYVIYAGRFTSKRQAQAARARLVKNFPGALVLHVAPQGSGSAAQASAPNTGPASGSAGASQASSEQHLGGSAYEKASSKLPSSVGTGGAPPPTDKKKAGDGSSGSCIGC